MDEQAESAQRTLALDAGDEVVGDGDALQCGSEDELARVQHEHAVVVDLDQLGEPGEILLHVDHAGRVIAEHAEEAVEAHVDRARLYERLVERRDDDAAGVERLT